MMKQKASVLEFLLGEELFCFSTSIVEFVFELEEFEVLDGVSPYILGIAKHDDEAVLLVDTLSLYEKDKKLDMQTPKSVVVVQDEEGATYGMVVDAIVQIGEVEVAPTSIDLNSEDLIINHYKQQDKIINEIVPLPLLKSHQIPSLYRQISSAQQESSSVATQEYLLFKIANELYALQTHYVEEVVEKEGEMFVLQKLNSLFQGALAVRDNVVRIADLQHNNQQESELVVVEHNENRFGVLASEVLGIESFVVHKIEHLEEDGKIAGFYNLDGDVVALVNTTYFLAGEEEQHKEQQGLEQQISSDAKEEYLLFAINDKDFAIDMKHIRQVVQVEDIATTKSSALGVSESVEFIAQWNNHAIDVIKLDRHLGITTQKNAEIIMLQCEGKMSGVLVDEIDDICYVDAKDVMKNKEQNSLIGGALLQDGKVIPTLNPKQILQVA